MQNIEHASIPSHRKISNIIPTCYGYHNKNKNTLLRSIISLSIGQHNSAFLKQSKVYRLNTFLMLCSYSKQDLVSINSYIQTSLYNTTFKFQVSFQNTCQKKNITVHY